MSLQLQRTCGSAVVDVQEGQGAFDCVLVNGHPVIQEPFENYWSISLLHHHSDYFPQCWLTGEVHED